MVVLQLHGDLRRVRTAVVVRTRLVRLPRLTLFVAGVAVVYREVLLPVGLVVVSHLHLQPLRLLRRDLLAALLLAALLLVLAAPGLRRRSAAALARALWRPLLAGGRLGARLRRQLRTRYGFALAALSVDWPVDGRELLILDQLAGCHRVADGAERLPHRRNGGGRQELLGRCGHEDPVRTEAQRGLRAIGHRPWAFALQGEAVGARLALLEVQVPRAVSAVGDLPPAGRGRPCQYQRALLRLRLERLHDGQVRDWLLRGGAQLNLGLRVLRRVLQLNLGLRVLQLSLGLRVLLRGGLGLLLGGARRGYLALQLLVLVQVAEQGLCLGRHGGGYEGLLCEGSRLQLRDFARGRLFFSGLLAQPIDFLLDDVGRIVRAASGHNRVLAQSLVAADHGGRNEDGQGLPPGIGCEGQLQEGPEDRVWQVVLNVARVIHAQEGRRLRLSGSCRISLFGRNKPYDNQIFTFFPFFFNFFKKKNCDLLH